MLDWFGCNGQICSGFGGFARGFFSESLHEEVNENRNAIFWIVLSGGVPLLYANPFKSGYNMFEFFKKLLAGLNPANNPVFVGQQLKRPKGLFAAKVADGMNVSNKNLYDLTFSNLDLKDGAHILEVGFGNGYFFKALSNKNSSVKLFGVEISKEMIRQCEKLNKQLIADHKLEVRYVSDSTLPYPDKYFEKAIAINLIYFWENPIENIEALHRVLKDQGELYIGVRPFRILSQLPFAENHFNIQQDEWWIDLFEKCGFELISNKSAAEVPLQFNGSTYEMSGTCWVFKKMEVPLQG